RAVSGTGSVSGLFAVDTSADEAGFRALMDNPAVEWVEPVQMWKLASSDPYYRYQWNMAGLQIEQVHARANGKGVVVAVIDSGVTVGADGPANVLQGYDVFDRDNDPSDSAAPTQSPSGSHGTHVAGTIAQLTNNGVGVAGVAPGASILPVRIGDYRGVSSENIAAGIIWAADNGAQVINLSVGGSSYARVVDEACRYAYDKGVVVVASSGNDGFDGKVSYPAAYPTVIAVGAHDANSKEAVYSNNGKELALLAPGGDTTQDVGHDGQPDGILQGTITGKGWGYAQMEGTSMASPHVAGAAAILISAGVRGPDAVKSALVGGAKTVNGVKVLDILGALSYQGPVIPMVDPAADKATGPVAGKGGTPGGRRPGMGPGRGVGREGKAGEGKGKGRPGKGSKAERPGRNQ
ncbi:MAG: S8 family serine peptidase, partial [Deltaproteobacteria bacterium]|nr:S8 family serine peptidase [Deltaproteobacteria bacterium]